VRRELMRREGGQVDEPAALPAVAYLPPLRPLGVEGGSGFNELVELFEKQLASLIPPLLDQLEGSSGIFQVARLGFQV
jgi:hypothetical protein